MAEYLEKKLFAPSLNEFVAQQQFIDILL
jgi:hypothetical protein